MRDDLNSAYRNWRAADASDDDDQADAAFTTVFDACISPPLPPVDFAARTMAAIGSATTADARRARMVRAGLLWSGLPACAAAIYFGAGVLLSVLSSGLVSALNLLVATVVWFANGPDARTGLWSILTALGRATAAFVSDPRVTIAMLVFQVVAVAALAVLHRLLGPEREWLK